jgi:hypothetical protein
MNDLDQFWMQGFHLQSALVGAYIVGALAVFWWSVRLERNHPTPGAGPMRLAQVSLLFAVFWPLWLAGLLAFYTLGRLLRW